MKSSGKLKPLTSPQIRAARGLLRWSAEDLAREAALGLATIRRAEGAENETSMTVANDLIFGLILTIFLKDLRKILRKKFSVVIVIEMFAQELLQCPKAAPLHGHWHRSVRKMNRMP
jgi:hypothetical protein